ncbi:hypothetical protein Poli38472_006653 [Pythium oligandrum]|uniref:Uncharacterized protein n=1 Tax=Pythium oligandrum TaxID=41045 RepID=A0A8K1C580_PYTOL|nr:hypothetical protein Poli38472_006653 [Pythium oligandrum]|eukprot:TMW56643.1 hypothetical protein Poli38472_006653 [Pythium oligandrum]
MADGRTTLSLDELYDAHASKATYQRLVDVINRQATLVERLEKRVRTLEATHRDAVMAQQQSVHQLDVVVQQLQLVQDRYDTLQKKYDVQEITTSQLVEESREHGHGEGEIRDALSQLKRTVETSTKQIRSEMATMEMASRLEDHQSELNARLTSMERRVELKLDKSEMTRLDGVVAKIQAFAPTATELSGHVKTLQEHQTTVEHTLLQQMETGMRLESNLLDVSKLIADKMDKRDWMDFIRTQHKPLIARFETEVSELQDTTQQLVHRGASLESRHQTLASKLCSVSAAMNERLLQYQATMDAVVKDKLSNSPSARLWRFND